jgi:hypothetical protein
MFHPRSPLLKGTATESMMQGRGRVREFFDLDPDDETVRFYQKKEFFVPKSENELKIALQTWHDLLELLTGQDSIAAEGLALILEKFDDHYEVIQEMFASSSDFGLTVLVILDNHLQLFFEMVSDLNDATQASSRERDFLWRQATKLLESLENRQPPSVVIRRRRHGSRYEEKESNEDGNQVVSDNRHKSRWQKVFSAPEGKTHTEFFDSGGENATGWPKLRGALGTR